MQNPHFHRFQDTPPSVVSPRNSWKLDYNDYICIGIV